MARPCKRGMDWFPFDADALNDDKFFQLMPEYGHFAPYLYIILISIIYKNDGYYVSCAGEENSPLVRQILRYFAGSKYPVTSKQIWSCTCSMVGCGLFSERHFRELKILTSRRIQREYYNATTKRRGIQVNPAYWMLSIDEMEGISAKSSILSQFIIDVKNSVNDVNNSVNDVNNPIDKNRQEQKRTEETREEQIRLDESREHHDFDDNGIERICTAFAQTFPQSSISRNLRITFAHSVRSGWTARQIINLFRYAAEFYPENPPGYVTQLLNTASPDGFDY